MKMHLIIKNSLKAIKKISAFNYIWLMMLICMLVTLVSCNDDLQSLPENRLRHLPVKIESESKMGTLRINYIYDAEHRLIKVIKKEFLNDPFQVFNEVVISVIYDEAGEIAQMIKSFTEVESNGSLVMTHDTVTYYYHGNMIAVNRKSDPCIIEQDASGKVLIYRHADNNSPSRFMSRIYNYDKNGNIADILIKEESGGIVEKYTYTYDENKSIFCDVNIPQWFLVTQLQEMLNLANNCNKQERVGTDSVPNTSFIRYEYNQSGYPVSETVYREGYSLTVNLEPTTIEYLKIN